jgi:hypothetical protein
MIYEILNAYVGMKTEKIPFVFSLMKTGAGSWVCRDRNWVDRKGIAHAGVENTRSVIEELRGGSLCNKLLMPSACLEAAMDPLRTSFESSL